jgi:hypothetical protein
MGRNHHDDDENRNGGDRDDESAPAMAAGEVASPRPPSRSVSRLPLHSASIRRAD